MIGQGFREHPELRPTGKVSIFGSALCSAERMSAYAARRNPNAPDVAELYLDKGARYGIRGDVAFSQAMLDTRAWTEEPAGPPWKPFAYAIWGGIGGDRWPPSELERRTELHLQKLHDICARREETDLCWEDLSGIWAVPGERYGKDITAIWRNMMAWRESERRDGEEPASKKADGPQGKAAAADNMETAEEDLLWLAGRGWIPAPVPHPHRKVRWAEMARVLRSWDKAE